MLSISRVAFTVGGNPIYWYGIIIGLGALLALSCACLREKSSGLPKDTAINVALIALPVGIVAARAYYVAFSWTDFRLNPISILNVREGGLAIWGGILGGAAAAFIYAHVRKISFMRLADLLSPSLILAQGIGRWGNFFNQEAYGLKVENPALMFFPVSVWIDAHSSWFLATFFYESIWCILSFFVLIFAEKKGVFKRTGDVFLWYVILYGFERTIVEGLRLDSLYVGTARVSQLLSLALVVACVLTFLWRGIRAKKTVKAPILLSAASIVAFGLMIPALLTGVAPTWIVAPVAMLLFISAISLYHILPDAKKNEV